MVIKFEYIILRILRQIDHRNKYWSYLLAINHQMIVLPKCHNSSKNPECI